MTHATSGSFWAIGVGPGDPELLTLKALRVLQSVHVIYHAGPEARCGRAYEIIHRQLRPEQECRCVLVESMRVVSAADWREQYRPGVEQIAAACRRGLDVAFVTEGDPTLYSTAAHVWQLLAEAHPDIAQEIVPGVSSIMAAAARVGWPLAQKEQTFAVVPASYHGAELRQWLERFTTVCFLKPAMVLPQLMAALETVRPEREAVYIENLGTAQEWLTTDLAAAAQRNCYFALVLVRAKRDIGSHPLARSASDGVLLTPSLALRAGSKALSVVGLGPGAPSLLTQQALQALRQADVIIGYDPYLRSLAPLGLRAELIGSPIGAEAERARQALELARQGRRVALVSSGDAGIYGMASLVVEMAANMPDVQIDVVPGVTAATAAASLLGAPLGHDFACISLSDLLTPWPVIEARLEASGQADFVLALYNPISQRRTWQLPRAREILLRHRPPETAVGLVDKAYRPGTRVWHTTLGELTSDGIGMETIVLVGNRQTHLVNGRMVTPRGYPTTQRAESVRPARVGPIGARIMAESFALIERELGPHSFPPWAFAVVRRMIHASADFEFAESLRYSVDFESALRKFLARDNATIVTDTEMVLQGIRSAVTSRPNLAPACFLNDPETQLLAESAGITRSAAGMRVAAQRQTTPLLAIGNAPTALDEALRLIEEGWRPAAIIGLPVGFVGVVEAKGRLLAQARVPYLTCEGRKGGSAVTAAAVNALVELSTWT